MEKNLLHRPRFHTALAHHHPRPVVYVVAPALGTTVEVPVAVVVVGVVAVASVVVAIVRDAISTVVAAWVAVASVGVLVAVSCVLLLLDSSMLAVVQSAAARTGLVAGPRRSPSYLRWGTGSLPTPPSPAPLPQKHRPTGYIGRTEHLRGLPLLAAVRRC